MSRVNVNPLRRIAADLGWAGHGGENAWSYERLVDRAVAEYWQRRPEPTADDLRRARYRRHKRQQDTVPPDVWLRRAGGAA